MQKPISNLKHLNLVYPAAIAAGWIALLLFLIFNSEASWALNKEFDWRSQAAKMLFVALLGVLMYAPIVNLKLWQIRRGAKKWVLQLFLMNALPALLIICSAFAGAALLGQEYSVFGNCGIKTEPVISSRDSRTRKFSLVISEKGITFASAEITKQQATDFSYPATDVSEYHTHFCRTGRAALMFAPVFNWPLKVQFSR